MTAPFRFAACLALLLAAGSPLAAQVTETPYTAAPGSIRIEMDGLKLSYGRADSAGNTYDAIGVAETVVSTGLTRSLDVQVGASLFLRESFDLGGRRDSRSGVGDISLRVKWTFWRDEDRAAIALVPFVKLPVGSTGVGAKATEGGLILPFELSLGAGFRSGTMLRWDVMRNAADDGYDSRWLVSSFLERHVTSAVSFYGEATVEAASTGFSHWAGSFGVGTVWHLTDSLEADIELLRGLGGRGTDWTYVARLNWEW